MCLEIGLRGGTKCNNPPDRDFILIKDATGTVPLGISHPPPPPLNMSYTIFLNLMALYQSLYMYLLFLNDFVPSRLGTAPVFQDEWWDRGWEPGTCRPAAR